MTEMIIRAVVSEFTRPTPDTLETRLLPYNTPTQVTDMLLDGTIETYIEEIAPSMFAAQVRAAHPQTLARVRFFDGHPNQDGSTKLGWATTLRSDDNWLYGSFRILPTRVDDVNAMLAADIKDVSVGFVPLANGTIARSDGSRLRVRGHLDHVALEPEGAYMGAEVLAMRAVAAAKEEEALLAEQDRLDRSELDVWLAEQEAQQARFKSRIASS